VLGRNPENVAAKASANKPGSIECYPEKTQVRHYFGFPLKMLYYNIHIYITFSLSSFIDQFFGGTFEVKMSSEELPDEPSTVTTENFLQLSCFISMDVKYMQSGLKSVSKINKNVELH